MLRLSYAMVMTSLLLVMGGPSSGREGFGTGTPGGSEGLVVEVTTLADAGPGSLRAAVAGSGPARVVFRTGGTIALGRPVTLRNRHLVTIDGATAPEPGITLEGYGLHVFDSHDIVVRHLRVRRPKGDGIAVKRSWRIAIDHCSLTDAGDENVSLTHGTRETTVSWSIIGHRRHDGDGGPKGMLIADVDGPGIDQISVHHNLFVSNAQRNPQVSGRALVDIRNNVVWDWAAYGMRLRRGARGNIVNNVFRTRDRPDTAILLTEEPGPVYIAGNLGPNAVNIDSLSTAVSSFAVALVTTHAAGEAELRVLQDAGAHPRDEIDTRLVQRYSVSSHGGTP